MVSELNKEDKMWSNIEINNDIYIISITQKDNAINIFLTNLIEIWMETLTHNIILQRCKALNPLLNVEAINCYEIVLGILNNISAHIVEASTEQIKLKVSIEGGSMKFALNLLIGKPKDFWENITKPLCISSMEIVRQHEFLLDLIKKKDEEIAEYKAEGAELIRKNIETKRFTEEQLKINSPSLNTFDYTNAFQRIINFYNIFNLDKYDKTSVEVPSTSNDNDKMVKTEQNINIPIEDNDKSVDKDISMQEKVKALNSKNESQNESKLSKEVANQKTRTADMVCRPFKKLKKRFV